MTDPRYSWVRALRALTGNESDDIRWNEVVGRWEFVLMSADGISRSQFWGYFDQPIERLTGLHPFRELDDGAMRIALDNLTKSFVANPFDGAGTTKKEVMKRIKVNRDEGQRRYKAAGDGFADLVNDHAKRLRGATSVGTLTNTGD